MFHYSKRQANLIMIHREGWYSGNAVDLYLGGAWFESRPGYLLS
jgi:hypothetical protein